MRYERMRCDILNSIRDSPHVENRRGRMKGKKRRASRMGNGRSEEEKVCLHAMPA